jgi:glycerol-3-phosphate dehydrogenase
MTPARRDLASAAAAGPYDVLIVGGGVNGAGIARDAAGRGLSVCLCEQDDLAAHTSSASTKLIHGGLRYLETLEFRLVHKALKEREIVLASAPHITRALDFVLPHDTHLRPVWLIRAGLFLYDHLAARQKLPASRKIDLRRDPFGAPLATRFLDGFVYADGWVDDARLVVLNARDAAERGALILTHTRCVGVERGAAVWQVRLRAGGVQATVAARALVNAAGPWAAGVQEMALPGSGRHGLRLVKGSHIVVPRLYSGAQAYIFQAVDGRVVFAIPYEQEFTLIGTTDLDYRGDPASLSASAAETAYLCGVVNHYFADPVDPSSVVWSYAGVRPLLEGEATNAARLSRDYALELDTAAAAMLSAFGGKITTYRRLAEEALDALAPVLGVTAPPWTTGVPLPGGDLPGGDLAGYTKALLAAHPALPAALLARYARLYGTRSERVLAGAGDAAALGAEILPTLYACEVEYLRRHEWASTARDILWRRTKLGLHLPPGSEAVLDAHLRELPP